MKGPFFQLRFDLLAKHNVEPVSQLSSKLLAVSKTVDRGTKRAPELGMPWSKTLAHKKAALTKSSRHCFQTVLSGFSWKRGKDVNNQIHSYSLWKRDGQIAQLDPQAFLTIHRKSLRRQHATLLQGDGRRVHGQHAMPKTGKKDSVPSLPCTEEIKKEGIIPSLFRPSARHSTSHDVDNGKPSWKDQNKRNPTKTMEHALPLQRNQRGKSLAPFHTPTLCDTWRPSRHLREPEAQTEHHKHFVDERHDHQSCRKQ